jgi:uncharacterized membrane protein
MKQAMLKSSAELPALRCAASRRPARTVRAAPRAAGATQRFRSGSLDVEMPLGAVQQLSEPLQAAVFASVFAALGALTYASCTTVAPALESALPELFAFSRSTWPLVGGTFVLAGVAHFLAHDAFCTMMPARGAWGLWYLPGSPSFHVNWTGVAEVLGGAGVILGDSAFPGCREASALGLFALTIAVTPANLYMATHNAPGPGPAGTVIPPAGHAVRFLLQVWLLSVLWGLAHPI